MKNNEEILKKSVQALNNSEIPKIPESLISFTVEKMAELNAGGDDAQVKHFTRAERIYKMKRYGKFAIAAGVMLAVLLGINFFPGQNGGIVWADALSQIQQVQNMKYRISMNMSGSHIAELPKAARQQASKMEWTVIVSDEYGMKMEMRMGDKISQQIYTLPSEKAMVTVMPEAKKYMRMELDEDAVAKMQKESRDPRYMASQFMESDYVELGRAVIDGIEVEGIATTDPAVFGGIYEKVNLELWADVSTGWPVKMVMDVTVTSDEKTMEMQIVMHDYLMNIEIDPAEFVPEIGDDYTELTSMKMPKMDGSSVVEGLKKFHDMVGRYPKNLNIMKLVGEMQEAQKEQMKQKRDAIENMTEEEKPAAIETFLATQQEMMKEMMPVKSVGQFYMTLIQEKRDPKYYGENVTMEDSDAILLRWRLDDGMYRVIFGDLSQRDVTAEELAELENVAGTNEIAPDPEKQPEPEQFDPENLKYLHIIANNYKPDGVVEVETEMWVKDNKLWRVVDDNMTSICDGSKILIIDHKNKTTRFAETLGKMPRIHNGIMPIIVMLYEKVSGKGIDLDNKLHEGRQGAEWLGKIINATGKVVGDQILYEIVDDEDEGEMYNFYVDASTFLLTKFAGTRQGEIRHEYLFDYGPIADEMFAMDVPKDFKMTATGHISGYVIDEEDKLVPNANIYISTGWPTWAGITGKCDSQGKFDIAVPANIEGVDSGQPLQYPVTIRAESDDMPGFVAWSVIFHPEDEQIVPGVIPWCGDDVDADARDKKNKRSECTGISGIFLAMEPAGTITGVVTDNVDDSPIENANITLHCSFNGNSGPIFRKIPGNTNKRNTKTKTDHNGRYVFENIPSFYWPDLIDDPNLPESERSQLRRLGHQSVSISVSVSVDGFVGSSGNFVIKRGGVLETKQLNMALDRADVTVVGRVIDNYGKPLVGYHVGYRKGRSGTSRDEDRTDGNGRFELKGCPYTEGLSVFVNGADKPHDWDEKKLTKGTKFVYYIPASAEVPVIASVYGYEVEIVAELPESVMEFEVKDTDGVPIEGIVVVFDSFENLGHDWPKIFNGTTDQEGRYIVENFPNIDRLRLTVGLPYGSEMTEEEEKRRKEMQSVYRSVVNGAFDLPGDPAGYKFEVTLPKIGERIKREEWIKVYDSQGRQFDRNGNPVKKTE